MCTLEMVGGEPHLDARPLVDGAELELLVAGGRWLPVEWRGGSCVVTLGGEWEQHLNAPPPVATLSSLDLSQAELRRAESPARATRVMALAQWLDSQAPGAAQATAVELDLARAHKQFVSELPRAIEDYQQKLRNSSFDLFHAASHFGAARARTDETELAAARSRLEETALSFEETSRWLAALQVMQSESG
jgi:hypothetical protein